MGRALQASTVQTVVKRALVNVRILSITILSPCDAVCFVHATRLELRERTSSSSDWTVQPYKALKPLKALDESELESMTIHDESGVDPYLRPTITIYAGPACSLPELETWRLGAFHRSDAQNALVQYGAQFEPAGGRQRKKILNDLEMMGYQLVDEFGGSLYKPIVSHESHTLGIHVRVSEIGNVFLDLIQPGQCLRTVTAEAPAARTAESLQPAPQSRTVGSRPEEDEDHGSSRATLGFLIAHALTSGKDSSTSGKELVSVLSNSHVLFGQPQAIHHWVCNATCADCKTLNCQHCFLDDTKHISKNPSSPRFANRRIIMSVVKTSVGSSFAPNPLHHDLRGEHGIDLASKSLQRLHLNDMSHGVDATELSNIHAQSWPLIKQGLISYLERFTTKWQHHDACLHAVRAVTSFTMEPFGEERHLDLVGNFFAFKYGATTGLSVGLIWQTPGPDVHTWMMRTPDNTPERELGAHEKKPYPNVAGLHAFKHEAVFSGRKGSAGGDSGSAVWVIDHERRMLRPLGVLAGGADNRLICANFRTPRNGETKEAYLKVLNRALHERSHLWTAVTVSNAVMQHFEGLQHRGADLGKPRLMHEFAWKTSDLPYIVNPNDVRESPDRQTIGETKKRAAPSAASEREGKRAAVAEQQHEWHESAEDRGAWRPKMIPQASSSQPRHGHHRRRRASMSAFTPITNSLAHQFE